MHPQRSLCALAGLLLASTATLASEPPGKPFDISTPQSFHEQAAQVRAGLDQGSSYVLLSAQDRARVAQEISAMDMLFQRYGDIEAMGGAQRVELYNAQESVNRILTRPHGHHPLRVGAADRLPHSAHALLVHRGLIRAADHTCRRSPSRATSLYSAGMMKMPIARREIMPATITSANGRCESVPTPCAIAAGNRPSAATNAVIRMGRNRNTAASCAACCMSMPPSLSSFAHEMDHAGQHRHAE